eukprot:m51a1_g6044 hypothetical protein (314) ;mRNA; r:178731-179764
MAQTLSLKAQDPARPTIFELHLLTQLAAALPPAVRYVLKALARRSPSSPLFRLLSAHRRALAAAALAALEAHSVLRHGASFAERFLGLCRVGAAGGCPTPLQRWASVALLAGLPAALDLAERQQRRRLGTRASAALGWLRAGVAVAALAWALAYVGGATDYASPWLHALGLRLVRAPAACAGAAQQAQQPGAAGVVARAGALAAEGLRFALPLAVFGYRSLEWWYSVPRSFVPADPIPPPPQPPALCAGSAMPDPCSDTCPLCGGRRANPAVLAPSGFAFCYSCIMTYVRQHHKCPLSGVPAIESQVRRLYLQ